MLTSALNPPGSTFDGQTLWGYSSTPGDITPACIAAATCTRPTISCNTGSINMINVSNNLALFINSFIFSAGSSFTQYALSFGTGNAIELLNVKMVGASTSVGLAMDYYNSTSTYIYLDNTEITNWLYAMFGSSSSGTMQTVVVNNSYIHGNAYGLSDYNGSANQGGNPFVWISRNSVWDSNGYGMYMSSSTPTPQAYIITSNSVFSNSTHDGINSQVGYHAINTLGLFSNDIFYGNGGYGVNITQNGVCPAGVPGVSGSGNSAMILYNNGTGSNTSGAYNSCLTSINDVALSASPFVSSSNFALNSTAGGGAALKAAGFPGVTSFGTGSAAIGPLQPASSSSTASAPHPFVQ